MLVVVVQSPINYNIMDGKKYVTLFIFLFLSFTCDAEDVLFKINANKGRSFMGKGHYSVEQSRTIFHPGQSDGFWLEITDVRKNTYFGSILIFVPTASLGASDITFFCNASLLKDLTIVFDINGYEKHELKMDKGYKAYQIALKKKKTE